MWCEICLHDENYECNKSQVRKSNVAIVSAVNGLESICGLPYLWGEPTLSTGATMMGLHSALRPLWWAYTQHWGHYDEPTLSTEATMMGQMHVYVMYETGVKLDVKRALLSVLTMPSVWNVDSDVFVVSLVLRCWFQISAEFRALHPEFRDVISDICRRMGSGMLVYYLESPDTADQWDEVSFHLF